MDFSEFDYRFAKLILKECYPEIIADVKDTITSLDIPLGRGIDRRLREPYKDCFLTKVGAPKDKLEVLTYTLIVQKTKLRWKLKPLIQLTL